MPHRDIEQTLKESEDEIRRLKEELESVKQELEAFTHTVSHDLRAPLRHINGFARILGESLGPDLPHNSARCLEIIQQQAACMGNLLDALVSLSRTGRKSLDMQDVDMSSLVDQVISDMSDELEGRDLQITRQDLPHAWGDPGLLKQVWANLVSNAVKFTRTTTDARIRIDSFEQDGRRAYYVKDNGVGFDVKRAGKLFGVFQRLHKPEEFAGIGIGLATAQKIIRKHGGRIWAEAYPNAGATFYFTVGEGRPRSDTD